MNPITYPAGSREENNISIIHKNIKIRRKFMEKPLSGMKVAILAANGCMEDDILLSQRALLDSGASISIISVGSGVIGTINDKGWGHNFAIDKSINEALAADYDMLVIADGSASHEKLKTTAHTKRFISGFMIGHKPVAVIGNALNLMINYGQIESYYVSGSDDMRSSAEEQGAIWSDDNITIWGNLMTGKRDNMEKFISSMMMHFTQSVENADDEMAKAA